MFCTKRKLQLVSIPFMSFDSLWCQGFGVYNYANKFFRYEGEWSKGKKHGEFLFGLMHLSMLSRWGGRPGKGGGFDSNHRPVVGFFDRFNGLPSNILLTFSCYFDNPQCPGVGILNGNSQLSSNAPPMPGLPPSGLTLIGA